MESKLTEKEIEFMECWNDPTALTENLIPVNIKAAWAWDENCACVKVRNYQFGMQNYSYLYATDYLKTEKQNFDYKVIAGTCFNIAARDIGKSFWIWIDGLLSLVHTDGYESLLASCDDTHLKKVADVLLNLCREHPFFAMFKKTGKLDGIKAQPIEVSTQRGHVLYGRNEKIDDPEPGSQFHSIHATIMWYEEASYMSKIGTEKRIDSVSSLGCIERLSGIPDIRVGSPLGDILRKKENKKFICRLPQAVKEDWDEKTAKSKADKFGGKHSTGYKLNVEAEIQEGAYSKWDMERIRKMCLDSDRKIKFFEVHKELFIDLENKTIEEKKVIIHEKLIKNLVITRLPCTKILICSDIGTTGSPSEIGIFFGDEKSNFRYEYQISLHKLTVKEQALFFNWLYTILGSGFIAMDTTNADGRAIRDELIVEYKIPASNLTDFRMNQNIEVDFLKDDKGKVLRDKSNKPLMREENVKSWGIQQLEIIFYNGKVKIPLDEKFFNQFANHFEKIGPTGRPSWGSSTEEHLVDMFIQFGLCAWDKEYKNTLNLEIKKRVIGYI